MSWLNKSLNQLSDVTSSISKFTEDVLAAEPPPSSANDGDESAQLDEYRRQLDYYKRELEKAMDGRSESMETKIELNSLRRELETKTLRVDELEIQMNNVNEELEDTINQLTKVSKRNSVLSKQNTNFQTKNSELVTDNNSLQKSLEEIDNVHQEELGELIKQRDELKKRITNSSEPDSTESVDIFREENEKLRNEINELKGQVTTLSMAQSSLTLSTPEPSRSPSPSNQLTQMKVKIAKIQKNLKLKIEELEAKLVEAKEENSKLSSKIESQSNQLGVTQQLMTDNENLANRITQIQEKVSNSNAEKEQLAVQVAEQESIMLEFATKIEEKEKELIERLSKSNQIITDQAEEISEWRLKTEIMSSQISNLEAHKATLDSIKTEESSDLTRLQIQVQDLSEQLNFAADEKRTLTDKMNQLVDCIRQAEDRCETEAKIKNELGFELENSHKQNEREIKNLESIIDQLQRDNRDFKTTEVKNSEEIDQLLKTIQTLKEQSTDNPNLRERTQELQLQLSTLNVDNKKLQDDLEKLEQEKLQMQVKIADDQKGPLDSIIELTEQLNSSQNNLSHFQAKVATLESQLGDSERCFRDQIEDLANKLRVASEKEKETENYKFKLEEEVNIFKETAASAETEILRLQSRLADLDSVNGELRNKIREIEELKNDLNETKQKLDSNSNEIEELRSQSSQLGQQNQELREIAQNDQRFATTVVELESQLTEKTDKYNKAKAELDETVAENVLIRTDNKKLQDQLEESAEKIKTLENLERNAANMHSTEEEVKNARIRNLEKVLANNEIERKDLEAKVTDFDELVAENEELYAKLDELNRQSKLHAEEKASQSNDQIELSELRKRVSASNELEQQLNSKQAETENLSARIAELENDKNRIESSIAQSETSYCNRINELEKTISNIEETSVAKQTEIDSLITKTAQLQEENIKLSYNKSTTLDPKHEDELKELRDKLADFDELLSENEELYAKLDELKSENWKLKDNTQIEAANAKLEQLQDTIRKRQQDIEQMEQLETAMHESLTSKIDILQLENSELQKKLENNAVLSEEREKPALEAELIVLKKALEDRDNSLKEANQQIQDLEEDAAEAATIFSQLKALEEQYTIQQRSNVELSEKYNQLQLAQPSPARSEEEIKKRDATISGLLKGQDELKKVISKMETDQLRLETLAVDNGQDELVKLSNHVAELTQHNQQLTNHIQQREHQLQLSLKQNEHFKLELAKMHQNAQNTIGNRVQDEAVAHLEAEKEQLHAYLRTKTLELREISGRLQETGSNLQAKTEQLNQVAGELDDARRIKEKSVMTQEAMTKLSHLVRAKDDEIEALKAKAESLMTILRESGSGESVEIANKIEKLLSDNVNYQTTIRDLISQRTRLESLLVAAETNFSTLSQEFEEYQSRIRDSHSEYQASMRTVDLAEEHCENDELSIATLRVLLTKIKEKSHGLPAHSASPDSRGVPDGCSNITSNSKSSSEQAQLMESSIRNLKERCGSLEAQNTVMKRDNDALRDQLMDRREKWDTLEINNKRLGAEIATKDEILANYQSELGEVRNRLAATDRDIRERDLLRERLVEIESEYEEALELSRSNETKLQEQVNALRSGLHDIAGSKNELEEKQQESAREQQKTVDQLRSSLENHKKREKHFENNVKELQQFIEHFRQQQEMAVEEKERVHASQLQRAEREGLNLRTEIKQIRSRMDAANLKAAESDKLRDQIDQSESKFDRLRCVIDEKAIELDTLRRRLGEYEEQAKKTVDKSLAKNIVLKYLSLPAAKKSEGIHILRAVFDFTEDESYQAESDSMGWRGWFNSPKKTESIDPTKSFSELFVDFLETESNGTGQTTTPRLPSFPANAMVGNIGKGQHDTRKISLKEDKNKGIEGRNYQNLLTPVIPSSNKHQNALLQGLLDD